jgi:hypothetical protein
MCDADVLNYLDSELGGIPETLAELAAALPAAMAHRDERLIGHVAAEGQSTEAELDRLRDPAVRRRFEAKMHPCRSTYAQALAAVLKELDGTPAPLG